MKHMQFDLIGLNCRYSHSCLSLFYLRESLQQNLPGCKAGIHQFTVNEPYYNTLLHLTELTPDVIFFSVYIWNSRIISRLIKDLSVVKPNLPMVLGGPQASVLGGEELPKACSTVRGPVEGLPDSFYRDLQTGRLDACYEAEEENPPFPFPYREQDFPEELANRNIYYESSRGCPFACSYCLSAAATGVRHKELPEVKQDLERILSHNPPAVRFVDRTFNHSAHRSLAIWHYLQEREEETTFHFEIAPDLFNDEMLAFLETVKPGKFQFEIGIQSTNPSTLETINRTSDTKKSLQNISRLAAKNNIHLHVDLIMGLPFEDRQTFRRSFNQVFQTPAHYIQMGLLKILPGTRIREKARAYRLQYCQEPPYQVLSTAWLPHEDLSSLYWFGECVEAFYNNRYFDSFFRYIKQKEEGFDFFSRLLDLCLAENFFRFAGTQEFMTRLLCRITGESKDRELIREILRYDWLRTGKRFLPDFLGPGDLQAAKKKMREIMPPECPPFYTRRTRNDFFKQGVFLTFSAEVMAELGLNRGEEGVVGFLPEQENTVKRLHRTVSF